MKAPGGVRRTGLARWFQILEERFMTLFWANLLCVAWALPFLTALFFFLQTWDWLSGIGVVLGAAVLGPGVTALNRVCMQIIRDKPVSVAQDFLPASNGTGSSPPPSRSSWVRSGACLHGRYGWWGLRRGDSTPFSRWPFFSAPL